MKNHYKVLQIPRTCTNKDIKNKTKELLEQIKKTNISETEKKKLSMKVYESYKFLNDYHNRKSLDDYLDSQYKIISDDKNIIPSDSIFDNFGLGLLGSFTLPFNFDEIEKDLKNNKNSKSYFYSKSSSTKSELDKDGNIVYKTKEYINDNGKKDEKEYSKHVKKEDLQKKYKNIKPITFII